MIGRALALAWWLGVAAAPLASETLPQPGPGDPRLQVARYDPDQVVRLEFAPDIALTLQFAADERIENVAIGAGEGWDITPNKRGDLLFLKQKAAAATTNLLVVTDLRRYSFTLAPGAAAPGMAAYLLRFDYPDPAAARDISAVAAPATYRVRGARALRPLAIRDDGRSTFITWSRETSLPAVYAVDAAGREAIVNGMMEDGVFMIHIIAERLVFRAGRLRATAERRVVEPRR